MKKNFLNWGQILEGSQVKMHNPKALLLGENKFTLNGPAGILEGLSLGVENAKGVAIVCHPHPLHEGSMHNKVVYTLCRAFNAKKLSTVRFNYRGVGQSEGTFGNSEGEAQDLMAVIDWVNSIVPDAKIWLAGFSFGAFIAAVGATQHRCQQLFSVSPAVHHQPFDKVEKVQCPWVVIQSTEDEVVPPEAVYQWFDEQTEKHYQPMSLIKVEGSHFYHGKLTVLKAIIEKELAFFN